MATINAQQARKKIVSPTKGRYYEQYTYVLDEKTKRLVRVRKQVSFPS